MSCVPFFIDPLVLFIDPILSLSIKKVVFFIDPKGCKELPGRAPMNKDNFNEFLEQCGAALNKHYSAVQGILIFA